LEDWMKIRAVTFDVYSALFDTLTGLTHALADLLKRRGSTGDPLAVAQAWRQTQREYLLVANSLDREPASNRRAIEASARSTLRGLAPPLTPEEIRVLVGAWEHLPPWPEVAEVLREVRRRPLLLGTLSNGDGDMLRALLAVLPVAFDHVISTEGGRFKPHPSVYRKALEILGIQAGELLHVAGAASDAMGATAVGIRTVWVNRTGDADIDRRVAREHQVADDQRLDAQERSGDQ
jgi:2-haloacid dehalogenase